MIQCLGLTVYRGKAADAFLRTGEASPGPFSGREEPSAKLLDFCECGMGLATLIRHLNHGSPGNSDRIGFEVPVQAWMAGPGSRHQI